jgi:hypothetical protein
MERFPVELLYVLGFIAFILYNIVMRRAARRRQQQERAEASAQPDAAPEPTAAEEEPLEEVWGRTAVPVPAAVAVPVREPAARPLPVYVEPAAPRRVHPVRALLRTERDLQRAMILVTVLGPCRAQEPR